MFNPAQPHGIFPIRRTAFRIHKYAPSWRKSLVKITKVETIQLERSTECYTGWLSWLWVRIHTDTGLIGLGETYPSAASEKPIGR